jgi:hypothetical protein
MEGGLGAGVGGGGTWGQVAVGPGGEGCFLGVFVTREHYVGWVWGLG